MHENIVNRALARITQLNISGDRNCKCKIDHTQGSVNLDNCECEMSPMSTKQLNSWFRQIERSNKPMKEVCLSTIDLSKADQGKVQNVIWNKMEMVELHNIGRTNIFNTAKIKVNGTLKQLVLHYVEYQNSITGDMASALCKVERVRLYSDFPIRIDIIHQIMIQFK